MADRIIAQNISREMKRIIEIEASFGRPAIGGATYTRRAGKHYLTNVEIGTIDGARHNLVLIQPGPNLIVWRSRVSTSGGMVSPKALATGEGWGYWTEEDWREYDSQ